MSDQKNGNPIIDNYKILKYSRLDFWFIRNDTLAWIGYTPFACMLVAEQKPDLLVELGTHLGNSYFSLSICRIFP